MVWSHVFRSTKKHLLYGFLGGNGLLKVKAIRLIGKQLPKILCISFDFKRIESYKVNHKGSSINNVYCYYTLESFLVPFKIIEAKKNKPHYILDLVRLNSNNASHKVCRLPGAPRKSFVY